MLQRSGIAVAAVAVSVITVCVVGIFDGMDKLKPQVMSCAEKWPVKGQVKVDVTVGPDGHVMSVTVKTTPDASLGSCVASVMQKATFARTRNGGSFGYPYTF